MSDEVKLPFGKHKGEPLSALPCSYLLWLIDEPNLRVSMRLAIKAELKNRCGCDLPDDPVKVGVAGVSMEEFRAMLQRAVADWQAYTINKFGDDNAALVVLHDATTKLMEILRTRFV